MNYLKNNRMFILGMWFVASILCADALSYADSSKESIIDSIQVVRIERDGLEQPQLTALKISLKPKARTMHDSITAVVINSIGEMYTFSPDDLYMSKEDFYLYKEYPFQFPEGPIIVEIYTPTTGVYDKAIHPDIASTANKYGGTWSGTNDQGYDVNFTVSGNNVTSFSIKINTTGTICSSTISSTVTGTFPITNKSFLIDLTKPALPVQNDQVEKYAGNFTNDFQANGTWYIKDNLCNATGNGTWNATKAANNSYSLIINKAGNGGGSVTSSPSGITCGSTCSATFNSGTVVNLTAVPVAGSVFSGWNGSGCTGTNTCTITLNSDMAVTATFSESSSATNSYRLTINKAGNGEGEVASSPSGITCGSTCSATFNSGTVVYLAAVPVVGSVFSGWNGGGCSGTGICVITMNQDTSISSTFTVGQEDSPQISVKSKSLNFGSQKFGGLSAPKAISIKNSGKGNLVINFVVIAGLDLIDFTQTNSCSSVSPGNSCTINVVFSPSHTFGKKNANVMISSNDPKKPIVYVKLSGQTDPPKISVSPKSLNFGSSKVVNIPPTKAITIKNTGVSDLVINNVSITGVNADEFNQTNSCSTIAKGATCVVNVIFVPKPTADRKVATLVISSNDPKNTIINVNLSGKGSGGGGNNPVCPTITLSPLSLPNGTQGTAFNHTITISGGTSPYTFKAAGLPSWLTLSFSGVLSGIPTATGTFNFTVTATDANKCTSSTQSYALVINAPVCPTITLPWTGKSGTQLYYNFVISMGAAYSHDIIASGGKQPYTYSASGLPSWLTLSSTGHFSGTPTATGTFNATITATDANKCTGSQVYTFEVDLVGTCGRCTTNSSCIAGNFCAMFEDGIHRCAPINGPSYFTCTGFR
jgi:hypothetical protein